MTDARLTWRSWLLAGFCLVGMIGLIALGVWQLERRTWKLALIDRVDQRVHASPQSIPAPASWPEVNAAADEYRHVTVTGRFVHDRETLVQAVTDDGRGFWVLTPLRTTDGNIVLVNRGFVPPERREPATRREADTTGAVTITGLLRTTEPKGRVSQDKRSIGQPLVFARRCGHRRCARPRAGRAVLHRCRRHPQSRRLSDRRPDRHHVREQPLDLCADMVCAGFHAGECLSAHRARNGRRAHPLSQGGFRC